LKLWKLNIVFATSEEHDKMSSIIQVATHAAIMAFGITLNNSEFSLTDLLKVSTPPFLSLSSLFGRIVSGNKNVYWSIQNENAYASDIRKALIKNLIALDESIDGKREEDFNELIEPQTQDQKSTFKELSDNFSLQFKQNKTE
jgi:prephenate dehydrogenase